MEFWKRIHWFVTSKCNEKCVYCFRPEFKHEDSSVVTERLARELVENGVEEVIFTGGEPLLLKSLEKNLKILKKGSVDISIHTNATLLNQRK